jgi:8-oxo-dGTP pyrophosphatase MutT (NUDIX family)
MKPYRRRVEHGETSAAAAQRELTEETGISCGSLVAAGSHVLPCRVHGKDRVDLFTARMPLTDTDVECHEGRQIIFADPEAVSDLDLTDMTRALLQTVLSSDAA